MADEKIFIDGMRVEAPREGAPTFVKGRVSVKVSDFLAFAQANQTASGWLNIDLKESRGGKWYAELNTYQKGAESAPRAHRSAPRQEDVPTVEYPDEEIDPDDIPF